MQRLLDYLTNATNYWERKRLIYNGLLALLVLICWGREVIESGPGGVVGACVVMAVLALLANVLFTLAYPIDLVLQFLPIPRLLGVARLTVFIAGTVLASGLALWVLLNQGMA